MTAFKRNSSRFSRGSEGGSNEGGSTSGSKSSSGGSKFGANRGGGDKKYAFTRIGSMSVPKSLREKDGELADTIESELRDSEIRLNLQIYPPKGVESVTLNRGDIVSLTFKVSEKDKDFVLGHASIPNNN